MLSNAEAMARTGAGAWGKKISQLIQLSFTCKISLIDRPSNIDTNLFLDAAKGKSVNKEIGKQELSEKDFLTIEAFIF